MVTTYDKDEGWWCWKTRLQIRTHDLVPHVAIQEKSPSVCTVMAGATCAHIVQQVSGLTQPQSPISLTRVR